MKNKKIFDKRLFLLLTRVTQKYLAMLKLYEEVRASTQFVKERANGKPLVVVEIGTQRGSNARSICNNLNVKEIYCIDPYANYSEIRQGKEYTFNFLPHLKIAMHRLKKYPVKFILKESFVAIKDIPNNVDFIYIDGNHDYAYCLSDIEQYYNKLKPGGVIAGHDFCGNFVEVIHAVFNFISRNSNLVLHTKEADWWFIKAGKMELTKKCKCKDRDFNAIR